MKKLNIVALRYLEPEYKDTLNCIMPFANITTYADRQGWGNMSKAFNEAFLKLETSEWVWFITNIQFKWNDLELLVNRADQAYGLLHAAAVHPCFESDHAHLRPNHKEGGITDIVPYVEFTAPLIRYEVFKQFMLDEQLPYWHMDLDWSHRVKQAGWNVCCDYGVQIDHVYLRNNKFKNPITHKRDRERKRTEAASKARMAEKYGPDWKKIVWPQG